MKYKISIIASVIRRQSCQHTSYVIHCKSRWTEWSLACVHVVVPILTCSYKSFWHSLWYPFQKAKNLWSVQQYIAIQKKERLQVSKSGPLQQGYHRLIFTIFQMSKLSPVKSEDEFIVLINLHLEVQPISFTGRSTLIEVNMQVL